MLQRPQKDNKGKAWQSSQVGGRGRRGSLQPNGLHETDKGVSEALLCRLWRGNNAVEELVTHRGIQISQQVVGQGREFIVALSVPREGVDGGQGPLGRGRGRSDSGRGHGEGLAMLAKGGGRVNGYHLTLQYAANVVLQRGVEAPLTHLQERSQLLKGK